ncbi:hypothetical protein [Caballeronia sp. LjRoot31]|jgi:hypothetical protein
MMRPPRGGVRYAALAQRLQAETHLLSILDFTVLVQMEAVNGLESSDYTT